MSLKAKYNSCYYYYFSKCTKTNAVQLGFGYVYLSVIDIVMKGAEKEDKKGQLLEGFVVPE